MALAFISNVRNFLNMAPTIYTDNCQCFMIPFFFMLAFSDQSDPGTGMQTLTLSMVGSVAASVSGLMTGGLYLFLKSNTLSTIGPKNKAGEYERQRMKHTIRRAGTDNTVYNGHMMQPVGEPGNLRRMDSNSSLISNEKEEEAVLSGSGSPTASSRYDSRQLNPLRSNPSIRIPRTPEPAQMSSMSGFGHMRKRSYSLFPNNAPSTKSSVTLLPATTYSPNNQLRVRDAQAALDALKPPPSIRNLVMRGHRRDSSMISSATVQIGLRLSSMEDMPAPPPLQIRTGTPDSDVLSLDCPKERELLNGSRPSPLTTSALAGMDAADAAPPNSILKRNPSRDAKTKTLPPVPKTDDGDDDESRYGDEEGETLSPTLYSSSPTRTKLPSPKAAVFTLPQTTFNNRSPRSPPGKAPPRRATGDVPAQPASTKEWI